MDRERVVDIHCCNIEMMYRIRKTLNYVHCSNSNSSVAGSNSLQIWTRGTGDT